MKGDYAPFPGPLLYVYIFIQGLSWPWLYDSFTTTYAIRAHHWCCEFESRSGRGVQHDVIKFVRDLRQVSGFLRVLRFPPPIKLEGALMVVIIW